MKKQSLVVSRWSLAASLLAAGCWLLHVIRRRAVTAVHTEDPAVIVARVRAIGGM